MEADHLCSMNFFDRLRNRVIRAAEKGIGCWCREDNVGQARKCSTSRPSVIGTVGVNSSDISLPYHALLCFEFLISIHLLRNTDDLDTECSIFPFRYSLTRTQNEFQLGQSLQHFAAFTTCPSLVNHFRRLRLRFRPFCLAMCSHALHSAHRGQDSAAKVSQRTM